MLPLLALLLVAVPDTTLPRAALGDWVLAEPVEMVFDDDEGAFTLRTLAEHVTLAGRSMTTTSVTEIILFEDLLPDRTGSQSTVGLHRTAGGWEFVGEVKAPVAFLVSGDTLEMRVKVPGPTPTVQARRYVRAAPLAVPAALVGSWVGYVTDVAGVPVGIHLRIHADGRVTSPGRSESQHVVVLGPYLLIGDPRRPVGEHHTFQSVERYSLAGDRLELNVDLAGPLVLERVRGR